MQKWVTLHEQLPSLHICLSFHATLFSGSLVLNIHFCLNLSIDAVWTATRADRGVSLSILGNMINLCFTDMYLCHNWGRVPPPPPRWQQHCHPLCRQHWCVCVTTESQRGGGCTACGGGSHRWDEVLCPSYRRWRTGRKCSSWSAHQNRTILLYPIPLMIKKSVNKCLKWRFH